jgi:hypothetical protein
VTTASGSLLVNNIALFAQQGSGQPMAGVTSAATLGQTYLFGGASQPSDVGGPTSDVTASPVFARYLFLRDLRPQVPNDVLGFGEIRIYGVPEPSTGLLLALALPAALLIGNRRRKSA